MERALKSWLNYHNKQTTKLALSQIALTDGDDLFAGSCWGWAAGDPTSCVEGEGVLKQQVPLGLSDLTLDVPLLLIQFLHGLSLLVQLQTETGAVKAGYIKGTGGGQIIVRPSCPLGNHSPQFGCPGLITGGIIVSLHLHTRKT